MPSSRPVFQLRHKLALGRAPNRAVSMADKEILDDNDEIIVYYGAADTVIAAATAKVSELVPRETLATLPK